MTVGDPLGPSVVDAVSADGMRTLAVLLDDPNPIHLDAEAVKALGLGDRTINQGPANLGYVMNMLAEAVPGAVVERIEMRFLGNVLAGDRLLAAGEVSAVEERRMACAVWLDVDGGGRVLEGTATLAGGG